MATRKIRWIEGFKDGFSLRWNQVKSVPHPSQDRTIDISTDRRIDFVREIPNPSYVPPEKRVKGKTLESNQVQKSTKVYKHPKATRDKLQARVKEILDLIQKVATGEVASFFFSAESNTLRYREDLVIEGEKIPQEETTTDDTLIEACRAFAEELSSMVASKDKPLEVAEPETPQEFDTTLEPEDL